MGEGGTGKAYANPARPDVILKVNNERLNSLEVVQHEYDVSKAVEELGLSIPKVYEIVRVGDAYGTITQLIHNKKSLSRICHDEPERTEEMAQLLGRKGKDFHSSPCNTDVFPNRKEQALKAIDHTSFDRLAGKFACLDIIVRAYLIPPTFAQKIFFRMHVKKLVKKFYLPR